jgi:cytochrome c oxidase assembly protein subunit 11
VTIELDANAHGMPWRFQPTVRHLQAHPGQLVHVEYEVANARNAPMTGQAVVSYGPALAGRFVRKLDCFCFTQQTLAAGENAAHGGQLSCSTPRCRRISTPMTLSYTFFEGRGES